MNLKEMVEEEKGKVAVNLFYDIVPLISQFCEVFYFLKSKVDFCKDFSVRMEIAPRKIVRTFRPSKTGCEGIIQIFRCHRKFTKIQVVEGGCPRPSVLFREPPYCILVGDSYENFNPVVLQALSLFAKVFFAFLWDSFSNFYYFSKIEFFYVSLDKYHEFPS